MRSGPSSGSAGRPAASRKALAIGLGGALGAAFRWWVLDATPVGDGFPWPVFAINVAGSALLGVVVAEEWRHPRARLALHDAAGIGFCGGLTTFSTFAVEVARFLHDGRIALAFSYSLSSVAAAVVAAVAGAAALRQLRALDMPLEGEP